MLTYVKDKKYVIQRNNVNKKCVTHRKELKTFFFVFVFLDIVSVKGTNVKTLSKQTFSFGN